MHEATLSIAPAGVAVRGQGVVPTLRAAGALHWRDALGLAFSGALAHWPQAWPALPAPIGRPMDTVPFALRYGGALDFSGATHLQVRPGALHADLRFHLPDVLAWSEAFERGTPLPPLAGRVSAPRLEIAGAVLEGVEIELDDAAAPEAAP